MRINFEKNYAGFRAEESTPAEVALNGWRYLLKYFFKKRIYTAEELEWAKESAEILDKIRQSGKPEKQLLKIGLAGDLMWLRNEKKTKISSELTNRMESADFWIGNLETPVLGNHPIQSLFPDLIRYHSSPLLLSKFRNKSRNLFGILSLANNHILDMGSQGVLNTQRALDGENILYSGTGDDGIIKECNGIKIGFYASSYGVNFHKNSEIQGVSLIGDHSEFIERTGRILQLMEDKGCHLKVISLHWGHEYEFIPTPEQRFLARELVKSGADIILGHHPHVIQPAEVLFAGGYEKKLSWEINPSFVIPEGRPRKALIAYSLGNFMTGMVTRECRQGMAFILAICKNGESIDWGIDDQFNTHSQLSFIPSQIAVGLS